MASFNQMLEDDSQRINSSFDESYDSNYVPTTPDSVPQTVPDYWDVSISDNSCHSLDMEVLMESETVNEVDRRSITSMEVSYYDDISYNQAQESLMDVSYSTDTSAATVDDLTTNSAANSTGKNILHENCEY